MSTWEGRWHLTQARKRLDATLANRADSLDALEAAGYLRWCLDHAVEAYVVQAREQGRSWAAIGRALGCSRQAVRARFASTTEHGGDPVIPGRA